MSKLRNVQFYRNGALVETREAAINGMKAQLSSLKDGELIIGRYTETITEGETTTVTNRSVLGIAYINATDATKNHLEIIPDDDLSDVIANLKVDEFSEAEYNETTGILSVYKLSEKDGKIVKGEADTFNIKNTIDNAINALNATVSQDSTNVNVSVTETAGKLTSITVSEDYATVSTAVNAETGNTDLTVVNGTQLVKGDDLSTVATFTNTRINEEVAKLDATVSDDTTNVNVSVTETDGKLTGITVTEDYATVATNKEGDADTTLTVDDGTKLVKAGDLSTVAGFTNARISEEINKLDKTAQTVVAMNEGKTALQGATISETDGVISASTLSNIVEFNQAISSDNKVATMKDVNAATTTVSDETENAVSVAKSTDATDGHTDYKVTLGINPSDNVLTQSADGLLANISMDYVQGDKKIYLYGKTTGEGESASKTIISTIDASDFVKDGMIKSVELFETAEEGETTEAPYLKITWNTDAGDQVTRISLKSLVDVYTADETYLHMEGHQVQHKVTTTDHSSYARGTDTTSSEYSGVNTIKIPSITVDKAGHVTGISDVDVTITMPAKQTASDALSVSATSNVATISNTFTLDGVAQEATSVNIEAVNDLKLEKVENGNIQIGHSTSAVTPTEGTAIVVDEAGESGTIVVPTLTIDSFGHITAETNTSYTVSLPASIATAIQSVEGKSDKDQRENLNELNYVNVRADKDTTDSTKVLLQSSVKTVELESATPAAASRIVGPRDTEYSNSTAITTGMWLATTHAPFTEDEWATFDKVTVTTVNGDTFSDCILVTEDNFERINAYHNGVVSDYFCYTIAASEANDGLTTAVNVKQYVDSHEPIVKAGENTTVTISSEGNHTLYTVNATGTPVEGVDGNPVLVSTANNKTTVQLETKAATETTNTSDYTDTTTTHTEISSLTVDSYGRVTAYTTTTVTENWDCGTYGD